MRKEVEVEVEGVEIIEKVELEKVDMIEIAKK